MFDSAELLPSEHLAERRLLLDLLAGRETAGRWGDVSAETFLSIAPAKLHPYLHAVLRRDHERHKSIPQSILDRCAGAYRSNLLMLLRRTADLKQIGAALDAAAIPFRVLKGPVLAATVYPEPAARTMIDLDVLVPGDQLLAAIAALQKIGYTIPEQFAGQTMEAGDAPPMIHPAAGSAVLELHTLLDSAPDDDQELRRAWASRRSVQLGADLSVPTLDRGEFFAHVCTHLSRHHRFEGELRSLVDVTLLLRSGDADLDWEALLPLWNRRGITPWVSLTVWLSHLLLDAPLPEVFRTRPPRDEALRMAAEQLWSVRRARIPAALLHLLAGTDRAPLHAAAHATWAPILPRPRGLKGIESRLQKGALRMRRFWSAVLDGALSPGRVASEVVHLRDRERLFEIVEADATKS